MIAEILLSFCCCLFAFIVVVVVVVMVVEDHRNLPLRFGQNQVSSSWDIVLLVLLLLLMLLSLLLLLLLLLMWQGGLSSSESVNECRTTSDTVELLSSTFSMNENIDKSRNSFDSKALRNIRQLNAIEWCPVILLRGVFWFYNCEISRFLLAPGLSQRM